MSGIEGINNKKKILPEFLPGYKGPAATKGATFTAFINTDDFTKTGNVPGYNAVSIHTQNT